MSKPQSLDAWRHAVEEIARSENDSAALYESWGLIEEAKICRAGAIALSRAIKLASELPEK